MTNMWYVVFENMPMPVGLRSSAANEWSERCSVVCLYTGLVTDKSCEQIGDMVVETRSRATDRQSARIRTALVNWWDHLQSSNQILVNLNQQTDSVKYINHYT